MDLLNFIVAFMKSSKGIYRGLLIKPNIKFQNPEDEMTTERRKIFDYYYKELNKDFHNLYIFREENESEIKYDTYDLDPTTQEEYFVFNPIELIDLIIKCGLLCDKITYMIKTCQRCVLIANTNMSLHDIYSLIE